MSSAPGGADTSKASMKGQQWLLEFWSSVVACKGRGQRKMSEEQRGIDVDARLGEGAAKRRENKNKVSAHAVVAMVKLHCFPWRVLARETPMEGHDVCEGRVVLACMSCKSVYETLHKEIDKILYTQPLPILPFECH